MEPNSVQGQVTNLSNLGEGINSSPIPNTGVNIQQPVQTQPQAPVSNIPQAPVMNGVPVQPQVQQPVQQNNINVQSNAVPDNDAVAQTVQQPAEVAPAPVQGPVAYDRVMVDVETLQKLVSQVKKVAACNSAQPKTCVYYMMINSEGLRIYSDRGDQTLDTIERTRSYNVDVRIAVDAQKFTGLVEALDKGEIELVYDSQQDCITVCTATGGKFKFPGVADTSTGLTIALDRLYEADVSKQVVIKHNELMALLTQTKPVVGLASSMGDVQGVYFTDISITTDSNVMLLQKGLDNLGGREFFLGGELVTVLSSLPFNPETFKVQFIEEGTMVKGLIFTDGDITLCGATKENKMVPIDACRTFYNSVFPTKITIPTAHCSKVFDRIYPFINPLNEKEDATLVFNGSTLTIHSLGGDGIDVISVQNPANCNITLVLPVTKLGKVIQSITTPTFDMSIDVNNPNIVCCEFADYKCIVSVSSQQ